MKKLLFLTLILLIPGCTKEQIIDGEITEIKYNQTIIRKEDYDKVTKELSTTYKKGDYQNLKNNLTIKTKEDIYYFTLSENKVNIKGGSAENKKLNQTLQKLEEKYQNTKFYTIDYIKNYSQNENDTNIFLDKTSNYIIIKFTEKAQNFKINALEYSNNKYEDVDLLYTIDSIPQNTNVIIRKSINYDASDIRISFDNQYGYNISIIPSYNDNLNPEFKTTYKTKNS